MNKRILVGSPLRIFISGTLVAAILLAASLLIMNPPQCTEFVLQNNEYILTRVVPEDARCVDGANIGLGLAIMLSVGVWILAIVTALAKYTQITLSKKGKSKVVLVIQTILVILIAALMAYLAIKLLFSYVNTLIESGYKGPAHLNN